MNNELEIFSVLLTLASRRIGESKPLTAGERTAFNNFTADSFSKAINAPDRSGRGLSDEGRAFLLTGAQILARLAEKPNPPAP